jgi:hypothetical protein
MTAIVAPKSPFANWLEGVILTAILQGLPTYAGAALMLRLARQDLVRPEMGRHQLRGHRDDRPCVAHALALGTSLSHDFQVWIRTAILRSSAAVGRQGRSMARAAAGLGATGDVNHHDVAARSRGTEHEVDGRPLSMPSSIPIHALKQLLLTSPSAKAGDPVFPRQP